MDLNSRDDTAELWRIFDFYTKKFVPESTKD